MNTEIRHEGIVESVSDDVVRVRILQSSACSGCKVASHCNASEMKEKLIDVRTQGARGRWQVGQAVVVSTQSSMASRALLLAFGIPLLLMIAVLAVALLAGCGEGLAAMLSVGVLFPYFVVLALFRNRISKSITFRIDN